MEGVLRAGICKFLPQELEEGLLATTKLLFDAGQDLIR